MGRAGAGAALHGADRKGRRTLLAQVTRARSHRTRLVGLSPATGALRWRAPRLSIDWTRWIPYSGLLVQHVPGGLAAYSARDGALVWRAAAPPGWGSEAGPAVVTAGLLVVPGEREGTLQVLDRRGLVGRTGGGGAPIEDDDPSLVVADGRLALATDHRLVVYRIG